mgnify:CR=1 FL=1
MSGAGIGMAIALLNVRGGGIDRGVGSGGDGMIEVVMRGGSSGSRGGMMGRGGERGVEGDQRMAIEGWKGGGGEVKVVEGDHTEHVQMSQRSSRHDG